MPQQPGNSGSGWVRKAGKAATTHLQERKSTLAPACAGQARSASSGSGFSACSSDDVRQDISQDSRD